MFRRYRFIRGTVDGMDIMSQLSSPKGEKNPMFMNVKIKIAPSENSLKNQLLLSVLASYLETVLML
jgi:hypothetical protein